MPFNKVLHRRDSWPPTILRVGATEEDEHTANDIDEDPFSFFLSPPDDDLDDDFEDLSAGIESARDKKKPKVRAVSPSSLARRRPLLEMDDDEDEDEQDDENASDEGDATFLDRFGVPLPISLRDFTRAHDRAKANPKTNTKQKAKSEVERDYDNFLFPSGTVSYTGRGRSTVRHAPSQGGRGRGMTRSLPTLRRHSWREPSPELVSIREEKESSDEELAKEDKKDQGSDTSEKEKNKEKIRPAIVIRPDVGSQDAGAKAGTAPIPVPKPKKRVHWAF